MDTPSPTLQDPTPPQPAWRPLSPIQRRVLGVLVEKAKTTPDAYPLTLNGLTSGCNQKSNRAPQMNLSQEQIEEAVQKLREMGAVAEVQGGGRVPKYRHYLYEWLGVEKVEASVMTELLLRGEQTLGDLRVRASRMDAIPDLSDLKQLVHQLMTKGLMVALTPEGRGQIVTHNLYLPEELETLRQRCHSEMSSPSVVSSPPSGTAELRQQLTDLTQELHELRDEVETLRDRFRQLEQRLGAQGAESTTP